MRQVRISVGLVPLAQVGPTGERWALGLLSAEERIRAERRVRDSSRRQFILAHGLKRLMLSAATGADPLSLRFAARDAYGKPMLLGEPDLDFSLTHTTGAVACAVVTGGGPETAVGIDLEAADRRITLELADRFFAVDETAWIRAQSQPEAAFLGIWTLKEAFVKAAGRGLALGLTQFSVRPPPQEGVAQEGGDPRPAALLRQDGEARLSHPVRLWQWGCPSGHGPDAADGHRVGLALTGPAADTAELTVRTGWPGLTQPGQTREQRM